MALTDLSVIIPTLNAAGTLERLLSALQTQDYPITETLVIDSGSTDQTELIARKYNSTLLAINPEDFDHGATRNLAAGHSKSSILLFMTQDALPLQNSMISALLRPLADPGTALSYARQIAPEDTPLSEQFLRLANYPAEPATKTGADLPMLGIKTYFCSNACAAYNRKHFEALGGFPEPISANEDMLFAAKAIKAGLKIAYAADALVLHTHNYPPREKFKRYFDIGASLDNEPQIRSSRTTAQKGFSFLIDHLKFIRENGKYLLIPGALVEAIFKYLGFKTGSYHRSIPPKLKKYLGLNRQYWLKAETGNAVYKSGSDTRVVRRQFTSSP